MVIVVTGGLGFIGSHFCDLALSKGYKVINIDKVTYASNIDYSPDNENYSFIKEDIKDLTELPYCDYIVDFAAESHVCNSISNSDPFINSNILGTYNILELLKNKKIENMQLGWEYKEPILIYVSTDEVFGDIEEGFFREDDRHEPSNPYSASKSASEMLIKAWGRTYNIPYRITRTTNNYGKRQHPEKLIPRCITNILNDKKIPVHGQGNAIRNWISTKDNCEAIMRVMIHGMNSESYHISSDEDCSVIEIVKIIAKKLDKDPKEIIEFISDRSGQDLRYALDNSKIKTELGWKQKYNLESELDEIILYYKENK